MTISLFIVILVLILIFSGKEFTTVLAVYGLGLFLVGLYFGGCSIIAYRAEILAFISDVKYWLIGGSLVLAIVVEELN